MPICSKHGEYGEAEYGCPTCAGGHTIEYFVKGWKGLKGDKMSNPYYQTGSSYVCPTCGLLVTTGIPHTCYGFEKTPYTVPTSNPYSYISPCDTCKLWDKCKKYRRGCFEEKEEHPTGKFVKGDTWLDQTCVSCHKKGMTLWWDGPWYQLRCDHCDAVYDTGRKMEKRCTHEKCTRRKLPSGMSLIVCNSCGEHFICEEIPG